MSRLDFLIGSVVGFFLWLLIGWMDNGLFYVSRVVVKVATWMGVI